MIPNKLLTSSLLITSAICGFALSLYQHQASAPYPEHTMHYPVSFTKKLAGNPAAGKLVYQEFCSACHANQPVIPVHAPAIGDKQAWHALGQTGKDRLLAMTLRGKGAMPARGGCFECSDEQVGAAIAYMMKEGK